MNKDDVEMNTNEKENSPDIKMDEHKKPVHITLPKSQYLKEQDVEKENSPDNNMDKHKKPDHKTLPKSQYLKEQEVPDGGWGYIVLLGVFISMICIGAFGINFGILYSDFLMGLGTSSTTVSLLYNINLCMINLSHTLAAPFVELIGWRMLAIIGAFVNSLGVCLSAFSTSSITLFISVSLLSGVGNGMMMFVSNAIIAHYFKKHLGKASVVYHAGLSLGGIIGPPFVTTLQEEFGYRGATLILGGLTLNTFVSAAVYHPVKWHVENYKTVRVTRKEESTAAGVVEKIRGLPQTMAKNFVVLKNRDIVILTISATVAVSGYLQFPAVVPFVMKMRGFTQLDASYCLSVANICNLCVRLIVPPLTDYSWFSKRFCYMTGLATISASVMAFCMVWEFEKILVVLSFWGTAVGITHGLVYLLAVSYVGGEMSVYYLGVSGLTCGIWLLACGPIYGWISDTTGSYEASLYILSGSVALSLVPWILAPYMHKKKAVL